MKKKKNRKEKISQRNNRTIAIRFFSIVFIMCLILSLLAPIFKVNADSREILEIKTDIPTLFGNNDISIPVSLSIKKDGKVLLPSFQSTVIIESVQDGQVIKSEKISPIVNSSNLSLDFDLILTPSQYIKEKELRLIFRLSDELSSSFTLTPHDDLQIAWGYPSTIYSNCSNRPNAITIALKSKTSVDMYPFEISINKKVMPLTFKNNKAIIYLDNETESNEIYVNFKGLTNTTSFEKYFAINQNKVECQSVPVETTDPLSTQEPEMTYPYPSLSFNNREYTVEQGTNLYVYFNGLSEDEQNSLIDQKVIQVESDDWFIASISNSGPLFISGISVGTTSIKATAGRKSSIVTVNVVDPIDEIDMFDQIDLIVGEEFPLVITTNPLTKNFTWTSHDSEIINIQNGVVKALSVGTSAITVSYRNLTKEIKVSVSQDRLVNSNKFLKLVSSNSLDIQVGELKDLAPLFQYLTVPIEQIKWSVSDSTIASVSGNTITGHKVGSTQVYAMYQNETVNFRVQVSQEELEQIQINAGSNLPMTKKQATSNFIYGMFVTLFIVLTSGAVITVSLLKSNAASKEYSRTINQKPKSKAK